MENKHQGTKREEKLNKRMKDRKTERQKEGWGSDAKTPLEGENKPHHTQD